MSKHNSANVSFLQVNYSLSLMISHSGSLSPCLISSASNVTELVANTIIVSCLYCYHIKPPEYYMLVYMHAGAQHIIYGQGQNNCIPKALQTNILLYLWARPK